MNNVLRKGSDYNTSKEMAELIKSRIIKISVEQFFKRVDRRQINNSNESIQT